MPIITLLTDFGLQDPYVGVMKGVIYKINPNVKIVDITHGVSKFNVREAAFILAYSYKYFPPGTIHVVVVDPGVGTARKGLIIKTKKYFFVGPDNGVLVSAAEENGIQAVYFINTENYKEISYTFHGRDVFAPTAAYLSLGIPPSKLGDPTEKYLPAPYSRPSIVEKGTVSGEIIYIDGFGNLVTNIPSSLIWKQEIRYGDLLEVTIRGRRPMKLRLHKAYGETPPGSLLLLINSFNHLEISMNMGNAANALKVKQGEKITVRKVI